ncbi:MAG: extracellular solute-binding protein [Clostridiales bacterium]|nr:extracellular solute-binding protein [Clostridiales bacterium]MDY3993249.1 extracellular solute-binding protein [Evtepia sp.]
MKPIAKLYTALIFLFLFAPIIILLVFSFNSGNSLSVFSGFSLYWYKELFHDTNTLGALKNTLVLAVCAALISTVMGTAAAVGINKLRNKYMKAAMNTVTNIPMVNPDIITGISLMLMFVFAGRLMGLSTSLNFWTMLIAHITFCLPYVILQVLPKLRQMDKSLPEAAMDLGCTPMGAFVKVELPEIMPGILTGLIMAFTLSLDDFVISYFTAGNGFETLPIRIYSMTKKTVTPKMYALATITFFVILVLLLITNLMDDDGEEGKQRRAERKAKRHHALGNRGKERLAAGVIAVALVVVIAVSALGTGQKTLELNIYNWGEYISDGSAGSLDTIKAFEAWYKETYGQKIKVNYSTYASNEDMYAKLKSGAVSYDVIIPSDYMIARLKDEGMLLPLNFDNIPNYQYIGEQFRGLYYDPDDQYSVPYTYGIVGIIYNANVVDEEDIGSWDLMWNPKYAGSILQFNNSRDAFGTAMYKLGIDVNTTDKSQWDQALQELMTQRPLVKAYVMDEIFNALESGEAAIGAYYAGDYFTMADAQADTVDLQFYYPDVTNYFFDAMCIPSCCENKELAEIFINYMLSEEPAIANAEYVYYACPNSLVYENETYIEDMGEDVMEILYPPMDGFAEKYNQYAYQNLPDEMLSYMNTLWESLKIN